jgi:hypothetical protein
LYTSNKGTLEGLLTLGDDLTPHFEPGLLGKVNVLNFRAHSIDLLELN